MIQLIFFVDGLKEKKDEAAVVQAAKAALGLSDVRADGVTSSLTITSPKDADIDAGVEQLTAALQEIGCTLKLPPNRVDVAACAPVCEPCDLPTSRTRQAKKKRRMSVSAFVASMCALLIVAILGTHAVATARFNQRLLDIQQQIWDSENEDKQDNSSVALAFPELEILDFLFDQHAIEEIDDEALLESVLKAYVAGTGDIYARYYTAEEFDAMMAENKGDMEGVGVSVVDAHVEINGRFCQVLTVTSVFNNSPALNAGVRIGDHIYTVTNTDGEEFAVEELGHDNAIACVRGISGTNAEFSVVRFSSNGDYEIIPFSITRAPITAETVTSRILSSDPDIGIVRISQFDLTTPEQFKRNMDSLIAQGCTKFIFDVRYNPGGLLASVEAVLSTLLCKGDIMISTVYKNGMSDTKCVCVVEDPEETYKECFVSEADIGKYRGYDFTVLTNKYTASAAELFAANLRDHEIGILVGEKTFGKGCMQSIFDLSHFGMEGALKLTTAWYQPPCGENYHDIGISPDVPVPHDEALIEQYESVYLIPDEADPQIQAAIQTLNQ